VKENSLAKRYAKALIKTIKDENEYLRIKEELEAFRELLKDNAEFKAGMETFLFSSRQKLEVLGTLNKKINFKEKTYNFLKALVEENRMPVFDNIIQLLEELWFDANGIEKLRVYSAVTINPELEYKLVKGLEK
jgi:F-type H+-transporting ATPase subunit delta